jgi:hypothetical protein
VPKEVPARRREEDRISATDRFDGNDPAVVVDGQPQSERGLLSGEELRGRVGRLQIRGRSEELGPAADWKRDRDRREWPDRNRSGVARHDRLGSFSKVEWKARSGKARTFDPVDVPGM